MRQTDGAVSPTLARCAQVAGTLSSSPAPERCAVGHAAGQVGRPTAVHPCPGARPTQLTRAQ
eukprot:10066026-Alexandrium_andersonii.AAC.1